SLLRTILPGTGCAGGHSCPLRGDHPRPSQGWVRCAPGCDPATPPITSAATRIHGPPTGRGADVERKGFTVRIARWSAEHPWRAIGFWVVFVAASIFVGNVIGTHKAENSGNVGETARAQQMI